MLDAKDLPVHGAKPIPQRPEFVVHWTGGRPGDIEESSRSEEERLDRYFDRLRMTLLGDPNHLGLESNDLVNGLWMTKPTEELVGSQYHQHVLVHEAISLVAFLLVPLNPIDGAMAGPLSLWERARVRENATRITDSSTSVSGTDDMFH